MPNTVVNTDIDEQLEREASQVLASIGLTVSDAVRLMLTRTAKDKALPFQPPRSETTPEINARRILVAYQQFEQRAGGVLWANNLIAVGKRMRWDIGDLQRGLLFAFDNEWLEKAPEVDGGIRLTAKGYQEMHEPFVDAGT